MTNKIRNDPQKIKHKAKRRIAIYRKQCRLEIKRLGIDEVSQNLLLALLGINGHSTNMLWSDCEVRWKASKTLARNVRSFFRGLAKEESHSNAYFVNFLDDTGNTSDRTPIVRLKALEEKVRRAISSMGLNAICVIEVHPLMNYPAGGDGRMLLYHVHAIAWTGQPFDHVAAEASLNASNAWNCALGADPVAIKPISRGKLTLERVCHYMMKMPHSAKNRMPNTKRGREGAFLLMDTLAGYRPELALRVFEGLSQMELLSVIFGVGDGSVVRQKVREELVAWHSRRKTEGRFIIPRSTDVWAFWARLRETVGSKLYQPYRFDTRLPSLVDAPAKKARTVPKKRTSTRRTFFKKLNGRRRQLRVTERRLLGPVAPSKS